MTTTTDPLNPDSLPAVLARRHPLAVLEGEGVCGHWLGDANWPTSLPHPGGCVLRYGHRSPVHEAHDRTRWQRTESGGLLIDGSAVEPTYIRGAST